MTWFPIFGAGFLAGWWMCAVTWPISDRRRPKPPSLKEQALIALHAIATGANDTREQHQDFDTIRQALEQLDD